MLGFEVLKSGPYTVVQDLGRHGYAHLAVTPSGAMDEYAYRWSQKLLDNSAANALEILLSGLTLKANAETEIAVCGADLGFCINGEEKSIWCTHHIVAGDLLTFKKQRSGLRTYLAVKGGFIVEKVQGSYAYAKRENKGIKLEKGLCLAFQPNSQKILRRVPQPYIPTYTKFLTLHILLQEPAPTSFVGKSYALTPHISPMGYKLQGEQIETKEAGIISEGIAFGAVQVPSDGQPIILLKERQSIGGYPNIGTVLAKDCFALAQLPIGSHITFKSMTVEEAQKEMKNFYKFFDDTVEDPLLK